MGHLRFKAGGMVRRDRRRMGSGRPLDPAGQARRRHTNGGASSSFRRPALIKSAKKRRTYTGRRYWWLVLTVVLRWPCHSRRSLRTLGCVRGPRRTNGPGHRPSRLAYARTSGRRSKSMKVGIIR